MFDGVFFYNGAQWHIKSRCFAWVYRQCLAFIRSHEVQTIAIKRPTGWDVCLFEYLGCGEVKVISFISGHSVRIGGVDNVSDYNE